MNNSKWLQNINVQKTLKKNCQKALWELEEINKNKDVRFKKHRNAHVIGDTLKEIELSEEIMKIISKYPPAVKAHYGLTPTNMEELIRYTGRLDEVRQRLRTVLTFWKINNVQAKSYVEQLLFFICQLQKFKKEDKKSHAYKNKPKIQLPICALCFEPIKQTNMNKCFCRIHVNKKYQQRDRNALLKIIRTKETPEKKELLEYEQANISIKCDSLYKFLNSLSPKALHQINYDLTEELWRDDWKKYATYISSLIQKNYPLSFVKIKKVQVDDFNTYNSYMDAFETALCERPPILNWLQLENNFLDVELILTMVKRVESYCILHKAN